MENTDPLAKADLLVIIKHNEDEWATRVFTGRGFAKAFPDSPRATDPRHVASVEDFFEERSETLPESLPQTKLFTIEGFMSDDLTSLRLYRFYKNFRGQDMSEAEQAFWRLVGWKIFCLTVSSLRDVYEDIDTVEIEEMACGSVAYYAAKGFDVSAAQIKRYCTDNGQTGYIRDLVDQSADDFALEHCNDTGKHIISVKVVEEAFID